MDRESPEVIEKEMQTTRESLTEKVSLLEQQVVGTLQSSTTAVQDTVESVKSAVQDTVDSVTGSVSGVPAGVSRLRSRRSRRTQEMNPNRQNAP